jgi:APA family basic amino acid/polyamine antiporter
MATPADTVARQNSSATGLDTEFTRGLGLFDSTMVVVGSMIGSGIFLVSADMARLLGSPGWLLLAWVVTGLLTITAALSYGELAAMMPRAGGQYVYLHAAFSPLWGFLYGWTLFMVIQTGTIAAVAVGFGRFLGVLWPVISESSYIIPPVHLAGGYALSLSTAQLVALLLIALLTWTNTRGLQYGKVVQNVFTTAKTGALVGLIAVGLFVGWNAGVVNMNFGDPWTPRGFVEIVPGLTATTTFGLFVALCVSQTGSLFAADAWNNITFTAGEVKDPRRNVPLSLALGTCAVIGIYLLANVAYLVTLSLADIQNAPADRVATASLNAIFPGLGGPMMAIAIMISTFGCANGLVLAGARAYYAMARDGLFFRAAGRLNAAKVPAQGLVLQGVWAGVLVLARTFNVETGTYGNLYSNLLDYVVSAALLFYILTILAIFRLRAKRPDAERPYRALGYPVVPALYILGAGTVLCVLFTYRTATTWPGLVIVLAGLPLYFGWQGKVRKYGRAGVR